VANIISKTRVKDNAIINKANQKKEKPLRLKSPSSNSTTALGSIRGRSNLRSNKNF
jgi:hypothetical protein